MFSGKRIVIKGAGDLATGVAARLWRSGFPVIMTEIARPLTVRRTVSLSDAVYKGEATVEDITGRRVQDKEEILKALDERVIPVRVDPEATVVREIHAFAVIDAVMAKRNIGTRIADAPFVIGLGPGFSAGRDVHAVVETKRGHTLGRVIWKGSAIPDTGIPGVVNGFGAERVIRATGKGIFKGIRSIGEHVEKGDIVAYAGDIPIPAPISGMLRGLLHDGIIVEKGLKSGDVDPRDIKENCWTISDKALAVGGGVLEAVLMAISTIH
ncbi:MAG: EF2563 family selenium-dependent molybdenum hydroxylase system protein [Deltaproteobacteria bacterium]|nr:EF2563 family selenium-dependent molybdenum hydroxylase system protein [Deltaproteobacteria bacterium]